MYEEETSPAGSYEVVAQISTLSRSCFRELSDFHSGLLSTPLSVVHYISVGVEEMLVLLF